MKKVEAKREFRDLMGEKMKSSDKPMIREAWNNYTHELLRDGRITSKQYHTWDGIVR
jgi:hypothetical protein